MERILLDDDFKNMAEQVPAEQIYQLIDILNKAQQEMRWTNHPKIFLEVAIVKLCQMEQKGTEKVSTDEIGQLLSKIDQLEKELHELKSNGLAVQQESAPAVKKPAQRTSKKSFQPQIGKINDVLKHATKNDLNQIKRHWAEMLSKLMPSHAALLHEAEPIAASVDAFIIKFKHEMICQMAMDNPTFIQTITGAYGQLLEKRFAVLGVPEEQWTTIRESFLNNHSIQESEEKVEEPHIAEAKKLFGEEFIEIVD
jgi:DNA polymerase-3 subunit gamma/tau